MSNPTILLVGGAWHPVEYFGSLVKAFEDAGYPTQTVALPSVGAQPPAKDFHGDVDAVRSATTQLISEKKDVIAVLHSLGGICGTEALHGLGKGSTGGSGVIAITYIASMVVKKGHGFETHLEALGDETWKPAREAFTVDGMLSLPPDYAQGMFYNDMDDAEGKRLTALLKPQSVGVYDSAITHDTYKEIPSSYILTTQDNAFKHDYQVKTVEMRQFPKERTLTLDAGHTPWYRKTGEVRDFVLRMAGA